MRFSHVIFIFKHVCLIPSGWLVGLWWACAPVAQEPAPFFDERADTSVFSPAELMGKIDPSRDSAFVRIDPAFASRSDLYLRREAAEAFVRMARAARAEGIAIRAISATRTFEQQKVIWERKWRERAAAFPEPRQRALSLLEYSSMPGTSRHHWGTDVDVNALEDEAFRPGGAHERVYRWLRQNAHRFGFCQPYTPIGPRRLTGYREEKWHWSYLPLAAPMLAQYAAQITDGLIGGFAGAETAAELEVVKHYVLGVDAACR